MKIIFRVGIVGLLNPKALFFVHDATDPTVIHTDADPLLQESQTQPGTYYCDQPTVNGKPLCGTFTVQVFENGTKASEHTVTMLRNWLAE